MVLWILFVLAIHLNKEQQLQQLQFKALAKGYYLLEDSRQKNMNK